MKKHCGGGDADFLYELATMTGQDIWFHECQFTKPEDDCESEFSIMMLSHAYSAAFF